MPAPHGPQFMRLYRGLERVSPDDVNYNKLGMHWTANPQVGLEFAGWGRHSPEIDSEGVMLEALVHRRHIITPDSPGWDEFTTSHSIFGPNSKEQEYPVKRGVPVHLSRIHHLIEGQIEPLVYDATEENDPADITIPKRART